MALNVGRHVGPYEVVATIGKGGMSAGGHAGAEDMEIRAGASASVRAGGGAQRK
jgi:hypothetical protein